LLRVLGSEGFANWLINWLITLVPLWEGRGTKSS
jgi:hypothetical protein